MTNQERIHAIKRRIKRNRNLVENTIGCGLDDRTIQRVWNAMSNLCVDLYALGQLEAVEVLENQEYRQNDQQ